MKDITVQMQDFQTQQEDMAEQLKTLLNYFVLQNPDVINLDNERKRRETLKKKEAAKANASLEEDKE